MFKNELNYLKRLMNASVLALCVLMVNSVANISQAIGLVDIPTEVVLTGGDFVITETTSPLGLGSYFVQNNSQIQRIAAVAVSNNDTTFVIGSNENASDGEHLFWEANMVNASTWSDFGLIGAFTDYFNPGDSVNLYSRITGYINPGASANFYFAPNVPNSTGVVFSQLGTAGPLSATVLTPVPIPAAAWLFGSGLLGILGLTRKKKA